MKTKLLLSLSQLVDKCKYEWQYIVIKAYNNFLKQAPKLYMFVPCDDKGNVLEKPKMEDYTIHDGHFYNPDRWEKACKQYQQALERVIFDGFEVIQEEASKGRKWIYISVENERKLVIFFNGELYKPAGVQTLADLSGKVYINENGQKDSGI